MAKHLRGIHMANGAQDWQALLDLGFRCFTYLDGESGVAARIRERTPDARLVMRLWEQDFFDQTPEYLARRCARYEAQEIIPWNEANLAGETGGIKRAYQALVSYWYAFQRAFRELCPGRTLHFPAWSPSEGLVGPFWPGADVYDVHCYGNPAAMLSYLDRCLEAMPGGKPVYISEWNFGVPWAEVGERAIHTWLDGLWERRERLWGATAFIYRWHNPDPTMPNYNLEQSQALWTLANWNPERGDSVRTTEQWNLVNVLNGWSGRVDLTNTTSLKEVADRLKQLEHPELAELVRQASIELTELARQLEEEQFPLS